MCQKENYTIHFCPPTFLATDYYIIFYRVKKETLTNKQTNKITIDYNPSKSSKGIIF